MFPPITSIHLNDRPDVRADVTYGVLLPASTPFTLANTEKVFDVPAAISYAGENAVVIVDEPNVVASEIVVFPSAIRAPVIS